MEDIFNIFERCDDYKFVEGIPGKFFRKVKILLSTFNHASKYLKLLTNTKTVQLFGFSTIWEHVPWSYTNYNSDQI